MERTVVDPEPLVRSPLLSLLRALCMLCALSFTGLPSLPCAAKTGSNLSQKSVKATSPQPE